jgi:hypothetical protein
VEFDVSRYGKDGIPLEEQEAMKYYILPHIRNKVSGLKIESIEEV